MTDTGTSQDIGLYGSKREQTSPLWDMGSCDGLVIYWFFGQIRFHIFNYKDRSWHQYNKSLLKLNIYKVQLVICLESWWCPTRLLYVSHKSLKGFLQISLTSLIQVSMVMTGSMGHNSWVIHKTHLSRVDALCPSPPYMRDIVAPSLSLVYLAWSPGARGCMLSTVVDI